MSGSEIGCGYEALDNIKVDKKIYLEKKKEKFKQLETEDPLEYELPRAVGVAQNTWSWV